MDSKFYSWSGFGLFGEKAPSDIIIVFANFIFDVNIDRLQICIQTATEGRILERCSLGFMIVRTYNHGGWVRGMYFESTCM